jgi:hypothetical protein
MSVSEDVLTHIDKESVRTLSRSESGRRGDDGREGRAQAKDSLK